jgi:hypothetical protein
MCLYHVMFFFFVGYDAVVTVLIKLFIKYK